MPHSHANDGVMTDQVTEPPNGAASPAKARSAYTNWEIGWSRTTGWIQCGNCSTGCTPTDNSPKISGGRINSGVMASGFWVPVPIRSAAKDSNAPITSTNKQKATMYTAERWNRNPMT